MNTILSIQKQLLLALLHVAMACMVRAETVEPVRAWSVLFGDFSNQVNGFDSWPEGVAIDSGDNVYVAGNTKDSFDGQPMHPKAHTFPYIVKISAAGDKLWTRTWGAKDFQSVRAR